MYISCEGSLTRSKIHDRLAATGNFVKKYNGFLLPLHLKGSGRRTNKNMRYMRRSLPDLQTNQEKDDSNKYCVISIGGPESTSTVTDEAA